MKNLITYLGWIPYLGTALKMTYISNKAYEVAAGIKLPEEKVAENKDSLKKYFSESAEDAYDEHLQPEIDKIDLPGFVSEKIKEKSIDIISGELEKKYSKRVSQ